MFTLLNMVINKWTLQFHIDCLFILLLSFQVIKIYQEGYLSGGPLVKKQALYQLCYLKSEILKNDHIRIE